MRIFGLNWKWFVIIFTINFWVSFLLNNWVASASGTEWDLQPFCADRKRFIEVFKEKWNEERVIIAETFPFMKGEEGPQVIEIFISPEGKTFSVLTTRGNTTCLFFTGIDWGQPFGIGTDL